MMGVFGPFVGGGICCDAITAHSLPSSLMRRDDEGSPFLIMCESSMKHTKLGW